jgi:AraC family transcriptional regulator, transcriptional activator of pobA
MKNIPIRTITAKQRDATSFDSFRIRSVEEVLAGEDMRQEYHRHDFYFMLALSKGAGIHEIDFTEYKIVDNAIFFMRPGQVHKIYLKAGSEGYLVEFTRDFLRESSSYLLAKVVNTNYCRLQKKSSAQLFEVLKSMMDEYTFAQENFESAVMANFEIFLIQFLRHRGNAHKTSLPFNPYQQEKLEQFLDILERNVSTIKQVSIYADMLNLSPFQLNSITKNLLGKTAAAIVDDRVILEAKRSLLATFNHVNQIAYALGYEDVSYFIRFFKKHTGYSPEAFRQNFR